MRKTKKHAKYNEKERNRIVKEYLRGETGYIKLTRKYDLSSRSTLHNWVKKYNEKGTVYDNRGKTSKGKGNFTSRKKLIPEDMSKEELIEYVKATEDIKKLTVFLNKQKKNIK